MIMKNVKKPPMRHCTGCGAELPKNELIRVLRSPDGEVSIDSTGKGAGRGAYLCRKASCLQKAKKSGKLNRSLNVVLSEERYGKLQEQINGVK